MNLFVRPNYNIVIYVTEQDIYNHEQILSMIFLIIDELQIGTHDLIKNELYMFLNLDIWRRESNKSELTSSFCMPKSMQYWESFK